MRYYLRKKNDKDDKFKIIKVGNYHLTANSKHPLETYLNDYKYYSRNLPRIAKILETKYPEFSIIDVGANIGDTIALLRSADVGQAIYCFEGEPGYFKLLQKNALQFQHINIYREFLGEKAETRLLNIDANEGTAKLNNTGHKAVEIKKLDDLAIEKKINGIKLLKIDTDGFDIKILKGSSELLKKCKPVLFFEYDSVFIEEQKDDGLKIFEFLVELGYQTALFYDNYGKLLLSLDINNSILISQLYSYTCNREGAFQYYDICIFHQTDADIAGKVLESETAFFKNKAVNGSM